MITFDRLPDRLSTVHNPIYWQVATDQPPASTILYAALWIEDLPYSDTFRKVLDFTLQPDAAGKATFWLDDILKEELSYDLPDLANNAPQMATHMCKRFVVLWEENQPPPADLNTQIANETIDLSINAYFALLAGFPFEQWPERSTLIPHYPYMLSQKSEKRTIIPTQWEWLYFMPQSPGDISLSYQIRYTDGSSNTQGLSVSGVQKYRPLMVPIGYPQRQYQIVDANKTIDYIIWYIPGGSFELHTETPAVPYARELFYFSPTTGSLESLVATGTGTEEKRIAKSLSRKILEAGYTATYADTIVTTGSRRKGGKLSIGYRIGSKRTEADYLAATEILESKQVYIRKGNKLLPITLKGDTIKLLEDENYLNGFSIEYEYAQPLTGNSIF